MAGPTPIRQRRSHAVPEPVGVARGASLPASLTSFVGREHEVAAIAALLRSDDVRLVTLTGPGGVGKTRLAVHAAEAAGNWFAEGVVFADLTPLVAPHLVPSAVAQALAVPETNDRPVIERLAVALRARHLLLLIDNFERVVDAAPFVGELLIAAPRVKVLITSREPLRLAAEHVVTVMPLADADAIRLFVTRAEAACADFALTDASTSAVTDVCRRLDGLPLAIELAAARVTHLSPTALLARLDKRLPLLTGGARDRPQRQRTMRDAIAWSYDLLNDDERVLFRRLAVFVGGCTLEAAEAVTTGPSDHGIEVLDGIASLVAKSLLRHEEDKEGEPRFRMLETVRELGLERLVAADEMALVRARHAAFFLSFAEAEIPPLWSPGDFHHDRIVADENNLRAALVWADEQEDAQALLRLAAAMAPFWHNRVQFVEGRAWLERALKRVPVTAHDQHRQPALWFAAMITRNMGARERARALVAEMIAAARAAGNEGWRGQALILQCLIDQDEEAYDRQLAAALEAHAIMQRADEPLWAAHAESLAGWAALLLGELDRAETLLEDALREIRPRNQPYLDGMTVGSLGDLARLRGDYRRAAELVRERLATARDGWTLRWTLEDLARIAAECGEAERAAHLFGAAEAYREAIGIPLAPSTSATYQAPIARAAAVLGEAEFAAAWAAGRRFSEDEARAEADLVATGWQPVTGPTTANSLLTPRELEVVRLVAQGRSNREIADSLYISVPTVKRHMTTVLGKLGLPSRSALNTYTHEHHLE